MIITIKYLPKQVKFQLSIAEYYNIFRQPGHIWNRLVIFSVDFNIRNYNLENFTTLVEIINPLSCKYYKIRPVDVIFPNSTTVFSWW